MNADQPPSFRYQRHLRLKESSIWAFFGVFIVIGCMAPLLLQNFYFSSFFIPVRLSIFLCCTILLTAFFFIQLSREVKGTRYTVEKEMIVRTSSWSTLGIYYANIRQFRYRRIIFRQGMGSIRTNSLTMRLPFVIENLPELVGQIEQRLIESNNTLCFEPEEIATFKHDATINELSTRRMLGHMRVIVGLILGLMLFNEFTALVIWQLPFLLTIGWMSFGVIFPLVGYLAVDNSISGKIHRQLTADPQSQPRISLKQEFCRIALLIGGLYLLAGIFYRTICGWWSTL
jgi:hypothetical protein